jgi:hypothetical protein
MLVSRLGSVLPTKRALQGKLNENNSCSVRYAGAQPHAQSIYAAPHSCRLFYRFIKSTSEKSGGALPYTTRCLLSSPVPSLLIQM